MKKVIILFSIICTLSCNASDNTFPDSSIETIDAACRVDTAEPVENFLSIPVQDIKEEIDYPGDLCKPCEGSYDCADGGACIFNMVRNETFCSVRCPKLTCPKGFVCIPILIDLELSQCVPWDPNISCKDNYLERYEK